MTADLAAKAEKVLAAPPRLPGKPGMRWKVVRQYSVAGEVVEVPVCRHRFELTADICAYRRTRGHAHETGGHYTARRADS
jgi:hypothetical protein